MYLQLGRNGVGGEPKELDRERVFAKEALAHGGGYDDELVKYPKVSCTRSEVTNCPALNRNT